jgi:hypothetical protein
MVDIFQIFSSLVLAAFIFMLASILRRAWKEIKRYREDPVANPLKTKEMALVGFGVVFMTFSVYTAGSMVLNRFFRINGLRPTSIDGEFELGVNSTSQIILVLMSTFFFFMVVSALVRIWKQIKIHQADPVANPWKVTGVLSITLGLAFMSFIGYVLGSKVIYQFF